MKASASQSVSTPRSNSDLVRAYYTSVWQGRDPARMPEFLAPDHVYRSARAAPIEGLPKFQAWAQDYFRSVPDYELKLEDVFESGDKVAVRWVCWGSHKGPLFGLAATGRKFMLSGITIARCSGGKIQETWVERDSKGLFDQLQGKA